MKPARFQVQGSCSGRRWQQDGRSKHKWAKGEAGGVRAMHRLGQSLDDDTRVCIGSIDCACNGVSCFRRLALQTSTVNMLGQSWIRLVLRQLCLLKTFELPSLFRRFWLYLLKGCCTLINMHCRLHPQVSLGYCRHTWRAGL